MLNHHLAAELVRQRQAQLLAEADRERLARTVRHHHRATSTQRVQHAAAVAGWLVVAATLAMLLILETATHYFS
jgi:hypothetical protein